MSVEFGSIHHRLYDQIRLVDLRTEKLLDLITEDLPSSESLKIRKTIDRNFGEGLGDKTLEELVVPPSIHQGLSELISLVETREAAVVAMFNGESRKLDSFYLEQGRAVAQIVSNGNINSPLKVNQIFESLLQVKLAGMPCDRVIEIERAEEDVVLWYQSECLQKENWLKGGVDTAFMFKLHGYWIQGFAETFNQKARYANTFFRPHTSPASEEMLVIKSEN